LRNALIVNERRKRIEPERSAAFLELLGELPISLQPLPGDAAMLDLARRCKLSVYDAAYLELAVREGAQLATLDKALRDAARRVKVDVWEPPPRKGERARSASS
jgi:predicted nucleic acid-binding protein